MSIGQRFEDEEINSASLYSLYEILGDRDTPKLFEAKFRLDTEHDIPAGGGNSLDRKTVYIDRTLYQKVQDGEFKKTGLEPRHIINAWCQHEHTEITIIYGDNPVDSYGPAHQRALTREHEFIRFLGADVEKYEAAIWPALIAAYHAAIRKAPKDLWCGPYLDEPTERDEEILSALKKLGAIDAGKTSKYEAHYGVGRERCEDCAMWKPERLAQESKKLALCTAVSGLVRFDRHCKFWKRAPEASS